MMINYLKEIISQNREIIIPVISLTQNKGKVILKETDSSAKLKKVELGGIIPSKTFAFKLDVENKSISQYLNNNTSKINTACNGIIFTEINKVYYVFLCEIKSNKPNNQECINYKI